MFILDIIECIMRIRMKIIIASLIILFILLTATFNATYYVDGNLTSDCDGKNYIYDVATRTRKAGVGQIAWRKVSSANIEIK